ncbi:hypothetical protein IT411_03835 [Candidatus Peregrinibacteria bacterium]|nr:hypothetical protein [Candidatus Peregrinibacteria bacterium]
MDKINLGGETPKDDGSKKPENQSSISINFTPKIGGNTSPVPPAANSAAIPSVAPVTPVTPTPASPAPASTTPNAKSADNKPAVLNLEIKKSDLPPAEKSEFFSSNALQEKAGSSKLMENIATQKAKLEQPKIEDLLGKKSTILEKSIEQETELKLRKKKRLIQFMAFVSALVMIGINSFLYFQLSPGINILGMFTYNFDSNLRNDLFNLNQSLRGVQTDLNKYRYLTGQLYLNQFGYESTRFLNGVNNLEEPGTELAKAEIQSVVDEAKNHLPELLAGAKANLGQAISVATYRTRGEEEIPPAQDELEFQRQLRNSIIGEKQNIKNAAAGEQTTTTEQELGFYDNALKLVGNTKLISKLQEQTTDAFKLEADEYAATNDPAQRSSFKQYIDDLLASTKVNLATIANLRNNRIELSAVMDRIEKITTKVNSDHNSGLGSANASSISYSSYEFNTESNHVAINGINTTESGTNREVITFLIEAFESSPEFKNVTLRSFPVSRTTDPSTGAIEYSMSFKIDLEIESGAFSKNNAPVADLNTPKVATIKVPVKHN